MNILDFIRFYNLVMMKLPGRRPFAKLIYVLTELQKLAKGDFDRLVLTMPSQHGKSTLVDIFLAYMIGLNPLYQIICLTYSQKLARRHSRNVKQILQSPEFREFFGWSPAFNFEREEEWQIQWEGQGAGATFIAKGIESPALGETADLLLVDDPLKGSLDALSPDRQDRAHESIANVGMQRLKPGGKVMMISTVWTAGDPPLRALESWRQSKANARYMNLAALNPVGKDSFIWDVRESEPKYYPPYEVLWPEYRDLAFITSHKDEMLDEDFDAQFMGCTASKGATLAPLECWGTYDNLPPLAFAVIICDTGLERGDKNDPSALLAVGRGRDGRTYVIDGDQGRWSQRELLVHGYLFYERIAKRLTPNPDQWLYAVPEFIIEKAAMGRPLFDAFNERNACGAAFIPCRLIDPVLTKLLRAREQSHKIQAGNVVLPRHWQYQDEFTKQWFRFPRWGSGHDEWVDLLAYGLKALPIIETVRGVTPLISDDPTTQLEMLIDGHLDGLSMIGGEYKAAFKLRGDEGANW